MSKEKTILYFGCGTQVGHYLFNGTSSSYNITLPGVKRDVLNGHIDGVFTPESTKECIYKVTIFPPLIIIAWHDYSVDKRPGSNSNFIFYGYDPVTPADQLITEAAKRYPWVIQRLKQPLEPETL